MTVEFYEPNYRLPDTRPLARMNKKEIRFNHLATQKYLKGMVFARIGLDRQTDQIVVVPAAKDSKDLKMLTLMMAKRCMRVSVGGFIKQFNLNGLVGSEFEIDLKDSQLILTQIVPAKIKTPALEKPERRAGRPRKDPPKPLPQTDTEITAAVAAVNQIELFYECTLCAEGPKWWKRTYAETGHPPQCPKCNGTKFIKTPREYKK